MSIESSYDSLKYTPIDNVENFVLTQDTLDKMVAEAVEDHFERFFEQLTEHLKELKEINDRHLEGVRIRGEDDVGVPVIVQFDANVYQVILEPGTPPSVFQFFAQSWPSLTLNAEQLNKAWSAYDVDGPTPDNYDAIIEATNNFNEAFSLFQGGVTERFAQPPNEKGPKSPPNTV